MDAFERFSNRHGRSSHRIGLTGALRVLVVTSVVLLTGREAEAIPPFARQTGLACNACHTAYPQLTPLGRQFKLGAYQMGSAPVYERLGAWMQGSFTRTHAPQPGGAEAEFGENDNFALDQVSLFYGGQVYEPIGAFLQGTYDGVGQVWSWDNYDIRAADQTEIGGKPVTYGMTVNNSPTAQDILNTTPVWGFPFDGSALAPSPAAAPVIDGGLAQISAGVTAYAVWDNTLYGEVGVYHTLKRRTVEALGADSEDIPQSDGIAPYWRYLWMHDSGSQSLALGTFGLYAPLFPGGDRSAGSDDFTDVGFDGQYQYFGDRGSLTLRASLILEFQDLNASHTLGAADRHEGQLNTFNTSASYTYDQVLTFTAGLRETWGSRDAAYYGTPGGRPDSTAETFQLDYAPLHKSPLEVYPWFDPRFTVQYVHYTMFDGRTHDVDGMGRSAADNDTLFVLSTITF
ncbi:MAG: hypothetical protein KC466_07950 [Myxococcales bacterium]|nr:hypothetical protein [Myxococcales bacterium]